LEAVEQRIAELEGELATLASGLELAGGEGSVGAGVTEPAHIIKDRTPVRHFAVAAIFLEDTYFPVCGQDIPTTRIGPRLTKRWRDVTCKRCLKSRWGGSVTR